MTERQSRNLAATLGGDAVFPMPGSRSWGVAMERTRVNSSRSRMGPDGHIATDGLMTLLRWKATIRVSSRQRNGPAGELMRRGLDPSHNYSAGNQIRAAATSGSCSIDDRTGGLP